MTEWKSAIFKETLHLTVRKAVALNSYGFLYSSSLGTIEKMDWLKEDASLCAVTTSVGSNWHSRPRFLSIQQFLRDSIGCSRYARNWTKKDLLNMLISALANSL